MRGVGFAPAVYRAACGNERLGEHLAAIHAARAEIPVLPAIDVDLEWLQVEQREQCVE